MTRKPERPYVSLVETDRPFAEEHHDAVHLLVIDVMRRHTDMLVGAVLRALDGVAKEQVQATAQQVMEKVYFTSLGGQLRLMGPGEAAVCLRVSLRRLHVLRKRPEFPRPVAELGVGDIWLAQDIERYDRDRKKTPGRAKKTKETEEGKT